MWNSIQRIGRHFRLNPPTRQLECEQSSQDVYKPVPVSVMVRRDNRIERNQDWVQICKDSLWFVPKPQSDRMGVGFSKSAHLDRRYGIDPFIRSFLECLIPKRRSVQVSTNNKWSKPEYFVFIGRNEQQFLAKNQPTQLLSIEFNTACLEKTISELAIWQ